MKTVILVSSRVRPGDHRTQQAEERLKKNEMQLADAQQVAHLGSWNMICRRTPFTGPMNYTYL